MEEEDSIVGLWTQQLVRVGRWKFKGMTERKHQVQKIPREVFGVLTPLLRFSLSESLP